MKLNNIEAARRLLDQVYERIDADKIALTMKELAPEVPEKALSPERFLFTVKIVYAEGLSGADGGAKVDSFLTLSDEKGNRLARTRTISDSTSPRCW